MGKIPEIQRNRLTSSVVGTPGEDRSTEAVFGAVANVAGRVVQQQRQQEAKLQGVSDKVRGNFEVVQFSNELKVLSRENLTNEQYFKRSNELLVNRLKTPMSPGARSTFSDRATRIMLGNNDRVIERNRKRTIAEVASNLDKTADELARIVSEAFGDPNEDIDEKIQTLFDATEQLELAVRDAKGGPSLKELLKFKDTAVEAMVMAAVRGILDSDSEDMVKEMDAFLNLDIIKDIVPNQEEIRKDATDYLKKKKALADAFVFLKQFDTGQKLAKRAADGDKITETEINLLQQQGELSTEDATANRRLAKSRKNIWSGDNGQTLDELNDSFINIGEPTTEIANEQLVLDRKKFTMGQISLFRQRIMESYADGNIGIDKYNKYLKRITPIFNEKIEQLVQNIAQHKQWMDIKAIATALGIQESEVAPHAKFVTSTSHAARLRVELQTLLMYRIDNAENISMAKGQGRLSAAAGSKIVEQVRKDFLAASGADIGKMKLGDLVASPNGTGKVIWFHPDGEAEIDRDLRAPIGKPTRIE